MASFWWLIYVNRGHSAVLNYIKLFLRLTEQSGCRNNGFVCDSAVVLLPSSVTLSVQCYCLVLLLCQCIVTAWFCYFVNAVLLPYSVTLSVQCYCLTLLLCQYSVTALLCYFVITVLLPYSVYGVCLCSLCGDCESHFV